MNTLGMIVQTEEHIPALTKKQVTKSDRNRSFVQLLEKAVGEANVKQEQTTKDAQLVSKLDLDEEIINMLSLGLSSSMNLVKETVDQEELLSYPSNLNPLELILDEEETPSLIKEKKLLNDEVIEQLIAISSMIRAVQLNHKSDEDDFNINGKAHWQINQLVANGEKLLTNLTNEENVEQISPKLMKLLKQWFELEGKLDQQSNPLLANVKSRELKVWQSMLTFYQKRTGLGQGINPYKSEATVTTKDIANWLNNALRMNPPVEVPLESQQSTLTSIPMSRIEQHVIYLSHNQQTTPVDKQLVDQFQQAMKTSRLLTMNNGVNQLSFTLQPDNLGSMIVRLTEIHGEMAVKIIVSSGATKKMLESNMNQLKHMFSPQQVVIEERALSVQDIKGSEEDQTFKDNPEEQSQQSNENKKENDETSFKKQFQQLLFNEEG